MAHNRELSQFANTVGYNDGSVGIGTDKPLDPPHASNTKVLSVGIVTANYIYGDGSNLTNVSGGGGSGINTDAQNNHYGIDQNAQSFSGTDATDNTLFGHQAGYNITTGDKNVVIGSLAGDALTTGVENVYVGYNAGTGETTQNGDVAIGAYALFSNSGQYNVGVGYRAGTSVGSSGDFEICIGYWAGAYMSGDNNISMGNFSMGSRTTTGALNIAIGQVAGYDLGAGERNTMVGSGAGYGVIGGDYNTFIGERAGYHFDNDASSNIAIGRRAGYNLDGNNNTIIGSMEYAASTTMNGQVAIGAGTTELVRINDTGLGIGTDNPGHNLEIMGSFPDFAISDSDTTNDKFRILHNSGQTQLQVDPNNVSGSSHLLIQIDGTERLRINSAGQVTMPSQPMLQVGAVTTASKSVSGGSATTLIPLNAANTYDPMSDFNSSTGVYTVPVSGRYLIFYASEGKTTTVTYAGSIYYNLNNSGIAGQCLYYGDAYSGNSKQVILNLTANDTIKWQIYGNNNNSYTINDATYGIYLLG